jgi:hypothetical protein
MCASVPLAAAVWIRGKLIELDNAPRNFGKAVRNLAVEWRENSGVKLPPPVACPHCDKETPGFFTVWRADGCRVAAKCQCNKLSQFAAQQARSDFELAQMGYIVRPWGYPGTWRDFEKERFPVNCGGEQTDTGAAARRLADRPQWTDKKRPDHAEQLALCEV